MKPLAIILIILVLAALVGVGYLYFTSNLTVTFSSVVATDPVDQAEAFDQVRTSVENETFIGTKYSAEQLAGRIQHVRARIDELTAQRDAIRDVRRCPGCGAVMPRDARFCSACGRRMPEDAPRTEDNGPADQEYCPDCGAQRNAGEKFCSVCGKSFEPAADAEPVEPVEPAEPVEINDEEPEDYIGE